MIRPITLLIFIALPISHLFGQLELHDEDGNYPPFENHIDSAAGSMINFDSFKKTLYVVNTGNSSVYLNYTRIRNYHQQGWTEQIADDLLHFNVHDSTVWHRPNIIGTMLTILPGDSSVFQAEVFPNEINGCSIYTYYIIDENGIKQDSIRLSMTLGTSNCNLTIDQSKTEVQSEVNPNPASQELHINIKNGSKPLFSLIDINGKAIIINRRLLNGQNSIDISNIKSGLYFYQIVDDNLISKTQKIVILR